MAGAAAIASFAGGGLAAYGQLKESSMQADAMEYNANLAESNATEAILKASRDERQYRISARKELGTMKAAMGSSGISSDEGSFVDVFAESIATAEMDALNIKLGGQMQANQLRSQAAFERSAAKETRNLGKISAAATLLSSGARGYSMLPGGK